MNVKKLVTLLLAAVLVLSLAACGAAVPIFLAFMRIS